jgi:hypothetical protein
VQGRQVTVATGTRPRLRSGQELQDWHQALGSPSWTPFVHLEPSIVPCGCRSSCLRLRV